MARAKPSRSKRDINLTHPGAAAIDIGATMHVAAVDPNDDSEPVRSFGTFTGDLQRLADWFKQCGVRTVAMESTGVYWIPAFELLDQRGFEVVLVNARDAKHVPGRKTDISDAQWLQRLHAYGLLRASFRPRCFVPGFDGAFSSGEWKEALWARFSMAAPQRLRRSVERYKIVKRA